ncbi:MAG: phosphate ABC transporter, permease protein PstA, partial [Pseudobutyrivibrio sp.]|nr:phosphate ABC transporter, permease protein PstA [Pseudobutyrivibrio sp.]
MSVSTERKIKEAVLKIAMYLCVAVTCVILAFIIGYVLYKGLGGISVNFLTT